MSRVLLHFVLLTVCFAVSRPTFAGDPIYVDYSVRADPGDEESDVLYVFSLGLSEVNVDSEGIDWKVVELVIVEVNNSGGHDKYWSEDDPLVGTTNGLWWVEHADTSKPIAEEFHSPPLIIGTAITHDVNDGDMDYDFVGEEYVTPPGELTPHDGRVTSLTHTITETGQSQNASEGDDEPMEVDEPDAEAPYARSI